MIVASITKHTQEKIERKKKSKSIPQHVTWVGRHRQADSCFAGVRRAPGNLIARESYFGFPLALASQFYWGRYHVFVIQLRGNNLLTTRLVQTNNQAIRPSKPSQGERSQPIRHGIFPGEPYSDCRDEGMNRRRNTSMRRHAGSWRSLWAELVR